MLSLIFKLAQVAITVFWLAMILSVASLIPEPYSEPIIWIGTVVLLIHLSEYFIVRNRVNGEGRADISFFKTMLFGITHWLPLLGQWKGQRIQDRSREPAA